MRSITSVTNEQ